MKLFAPIFFHKEPARCAVLLLFVCAVALGLSGCGQTDTRWKDPSRLQPKPKQDTPVIETLRAEIKNNPRSAEAYARLGFKLLEDERFREAEDAFFAANNLEPNLMSARLGRWQIYSRLTDPTNTVVLAVGATRLDPRDPIAEPILKEAAKAFDRALVTRPSDSWVLIHAAVVQAKLNNWERAQGYAYRASTGLHTSPHLLFADVLLQHGQVERAAEELQKVAAPDAVTFDTVGRVQEARGNYEAALRAYERASQMRPDWHVPPIRAGYLCLRLRRADLAAEYFMRAEKISPMDATVLFALAELRMLAGDDDGAIAIYEKMVAAEMGSANVLNNFAYLLSKKPDQRARALELARRAETADPTNPAVKGTLGWILHLLGKHDEALPYLRVAVRGMPDHGTTQYQLAKTLLALNRREEGLAAMRLALERGLPAEEQRDAERILAKP
jgi:tetratricopeptide (TPR) repeat protein